MTNSPHSRGNPLVRFVGLIFIIAGIGWILFSGGCAIVAIATMLGDLRKGDEPWVWATAFLGIGSVALGLIVWWFGRYLYRMPS